MTNTRHFDDYERYVPLKRLVSLPAYRSWLTESSVRHLIFSARPRMNSKGEELPTNGLDKAIIKLGRKILIDRVEFDIWIEKQRLTSNDSLAWNN